MVKAAAALLMLGIVGTAHAGETPDLADLAKSWPTHFALSGTKTEPTYIEHISLVRDGDVFTLAGGAPAGMSPSEERIEVTADGTLHRLSCPAAMNCADGRVPAGFLASAAILAAIKRGALTGPVMPLRYGAYRVVCIKAETLGIANPVLDPCIEIHSGAVLAQRHRRSGRFDGPSLDPASIELSLVPDAIAIASH